MNDDDSDDMTPAGYQAECEVGGYVLASEWEDLDDVADDLAPDLAALLLGEGRRDVVRVGLCGRASS